MLDWGKAGVRLSWWPAKPQEESDDGTPSALAGTDEQELGKMPEGASLGI